MAQLRRADVENLPYPDGYFDTVVNTMSFSGYPNAQQAMSELHRVLHRRGRLVLIDIGYPMTAIDSAAPSSGCGSARRPDPRHDKAVERVPSRYRPHADRWFRQCPSLRCHQTVSARRIYVHRANCGAREAGTSRD